MRLHVGDAVDPTCAFAGADAIDARGTMNEKILHLRSSGGFYGAEQVILNLARELNALGCTNHVVCFNNTQNPHLELVEQATKAHLSAFAIDCRGIIDRRTINDIREIIRSEDIDVIHGHDYKTRFFGLCAANGLKVKKIATNHGWPRPSLRGRVYETIDGVLFNGFDKVVAVSEFTEKECRPFVFKKDKLICIHNGIDPRAFTLENREERRRSTRAQLGLKDSDLVIGNVGRLSIEKDQATMLRAFKILTGLSREKSLKVLFVGDGPEEHSLMEMARELGVYNQCVFAGVRTDIPQVLNCLDVYVQSSRREGLPMTILEAMASGTSASS